MDCQLIPGCLSKVILNLHHSSDHVLITKDSDGDEMGWSQTCNVNNQGLLKVGSYPVASAIFTFNKMAVKAKSLMRMSLTTCQLDDVLAACRESLRPFNGSVIANGKAVAEKTRYPCTS